MPKIEGTIPHSKVSTCLYGLTLVIGAFPIWVYSIMLFLPRNPSHMGAPVATIEAKTPSRLTATEQNIKYIGEGYTPACAEDKEEALGYYTEYLDRTNKPNPPATYTQEEWYQELLDKGYILELTETRRTAKYYEFVTRSVTRESYFELVRVHSCDYFDPEGNSLVIDNYDEPVNIGIYGGQTTKEHLDDFAIYAVHMLDLDAAIYSQNSTLTGDEYIFTAKSRNHPKELNRAFETVETTVTLSVDLESGQTTVFVEEQ